MPERTQALFPARLKKRAVAWAREQKISFGEFVRRAVEQQLASSPRGSGRKSGDPFWDNLVAYDDDAPADLSVRHDEYLYGGTL